MARNRVSAYFMNDSERRQAQELMGSSSLSTDGFVFGEVDDATLAKLRQTKLALSVPREESEEVPEAAETMQSVQMLASPVYSEVVHLESAMLPSDPDFYSIKLRGPLIEEWRDQFRGIGVSLLQALYYDKYKALLFLEQANSVRNLPFVDAVDWITPRQSTPRMTTQFVAPAVGTTPPAGLKMLTFDIRLHLPEGRKTVEDWLRSHNLAIAGSSGRKIRFYALENAPELAEIATLTEVDRVDEYAEPKLSNDVARRLIGVDAPSGHNPASFISQEGDQQIIAIADTGIDDQHPDFAGRIIGKVGLGRPNDTSDPHGHGTHVAGSVLGDGSASSGKVRGTAPKASLFFQSLLDAKGKLGGLPLDLNDLFVEAYNRGARIHNNSWGAETSSTYTINSEEVDEFVRNHPDMLILIAAGNAGTGAQPRKASPGFVDWLSIGSPASCKNALTVGASRSERTDGPMAKTTWRMGWPLAYPDPPIANEFVSGDPMSMAAFSSRGPCDDYRIKPDLVAPGTDIASTRSSLAPQSRYWGVYPFPDPLKPLPVNPRYGYMGGTSMATPLVAGCAALVREYFVKEQKHQPSAALLKATLVNGTVWLSGNDSTAPEPGVPNYHQGHGRISMERTIPNASDPNFQLQFIDEWNDITASLTRTGEVRRYTFSLPGSGSPLRVCLAYTDAPARGLQNNLNVIVQDPSMTKWVGNSKLPNSLTSLDTTNNVESVRIDSAPAGSYVVQVVASNMLKPPQDFALVVTGSSVSSLTRI